MIRFVKCSLLVFGFFFSCNQGLAYQDDSNAKTACRDRQFTFSWSLHHACGMVPRGGTSKGAKVTLDSAPHPGWLALQTPEIERFEKDRRAILAMAGPYRTSFDFLETVGYTESFSPDRPYQSWGTEYVYVAEDRGDFISLQHIMVMFFERENGEVSAPMVMKHWRQDWRYEKRNLLQYVGRQTWKTTKISRRQARGTWAQAVYQVDDSPRYESFGRWRHHDNFSTWISDTTWRPLPRREHSVRDDYHVLEGTNRHTIVATGWVHEEENYKVVLGDENSASKPVIVAKELGLNRYERIVGHDFSAGDSYWRNTGEYWRDVRAVWEDLIARGSGIRLQQQVNGTPLFMPLFEYGSALDATSYKSRDGRLFIQQTIAPYIVD